MDWIKSAAMDWWDSTASKRLVAGLITAVLTTIASSSGFLSEDAAFRIAGIVIALIVGDSYRPINPKKPIEEKSGD